MNREKELSLSLYLSTKLSIFLGEEANAMIQEHDISYDEAVKVIQGVLLLTLSVLRINNEE